MKKLKKKKKSKPEEKQSYWHYAPFKDSSGWHVREIFRSFGRGIPHFMWSSEHEAPHGNTYKELLADISYMMIDIIGYPKYELKAEIQASKKLPKEFKGKDKPHNKYEPSRFENHRRK
jgi:hypothetical protein